MSEEKITLEELKNEKVKNESGRKEVDVSTVAQTMQEKNNVQPKEKPKAYDSYISEILETAGKKVSDEVFEQAKEIVVNHIEEVQTNKIDNEDDDEEKNNIKELENISENNEFYQDNVSNMIDEMNNEFYDEFEEEFDDNFEKQEKQLETVKTKIKEKIQPVTEKIDLQSFTISNKPISMFKAFENGFDSSVNVSDWVLFNTGIQISIKEMKGYDIQKLDPRSSSRNEYNTFRDIYRKIYDHIVNEDKPEFETFLKLIKYSDIPHLHFGVYKSSFNKSNLLTYQCTNKKCEEVFLENVEINELYKFENEEVEKEFNEILNYQGSEFKPKHYDVELLQISNECAVALKEPSIFNLVFETSVLSEQYRQKYADIITILSYIDNIYYIDRKSNSLVPIELKTYEKDLGKTVRYKIMQYSKVLNNLNSDQYYLLTSAMSKIDKERNIIYVTPERTCPKCGTVIKEERITPENLLFTRHQLAALANI